MASSTASPSRPCSRFAPSSKTGTSSGSWRQTSSRSLSGGRVLRRNIVRPRSDRDLEALSEATHHAAPQRQIGGRAGGISVARDDDGAHRRWERNLAEIGRAATDDDVFGPGRSRRQALLQPFRLDRLRAGDPRRQRPGLFAPRIVMRAGSCGDLQAIGGDISHQQSDELAVVVGDRSEKRALVAAIVGDPAQLRLVLGAKRQAARLGDVDVAGRVVDRLRRHRRDARRTSSPRLRRSRRPVRRSRPGRRRQRRNGTRAMRAPIRSRLRLDRDARSARNALWPCSRAPPEKS